MVTAGLTFGTSWFVGDLAQQQTVAVVAAAGVDPASVSPVGAGAIPDIFDGQARFSFVK